MNKGHPSRISSKLMESTLCSVYARYWPQRSIAPQTQQDNKFALQTHTSFGPRVHRRCNPMCNFQCVGLADGLVRVYKCAIVDSLEMHYMRCTTDEAAMLDGVARWMVASCSKNVSQRVFGPASQPASAARLFAWRS